MVSLKEKYVQEVVPKLREERGIANAMRVPKLEKIVVNMGLGIQDKDTQKKLVDDLETITGQRPVLTRAKKSISNFKLREGMVVGAKVTLRGVRMYEFLDRLISAALPRIRDFRGIAATGFDGRGNYTLGLNDQTIFPEIDPNNVGATQGMDITLVTSAENKDDAYALLKLLGMPFAEKK